MAWKAEICAFEISSGFTHYEVRVTAENITDALHLTDLLKNRIVNGNEAWMRVEPEAEFKGYIESESEEIESGIEEIDGDEIEICYGGQEAIFGGYTRFVCGNNLGPIHPPEKYPFGSISESEGARICGGS